MIKMAIIGLIPPNYCLSTPLATMHNSLYIFHGNSKKYKACRMPGVCIDALRGTFFSDKMASRSGSRIRVGFEGSFRMFHSEKGLNSPAEFDALRKVHTSKDWIRWISPLGHTMHLIKPFILSQSQIIIKAWVCTIVSVVALFYFIPQTGELSDLLMKGEMKSLLKKCSIMVALLSLRSVAHFLEQAWLWEAALKISYEIRSHVFERVVLKDLEYFEGRDGMPAGDIAYRLTAEAEDTGDTVYALLQAAVPSTFQLAAMSLRMVLLSPLLSIATILVSPCMYMAITFLGKNLRQISRHGQESIARLSAYLNQLLPSMLTVKACAAEDFEHWRFKKLAMIDCEACLQKKRMKAFIPEAITAIYAAKAVIIFGVAAWAISHGCFDGHQLVSFATSLILLAQPIQALGKSYNELKQGEPAIERLFALVSSPGKVTDREDAISLPGVHGDIRFSKVAFRYNDSVSNVLSDITLHVRPGEKIALVGPSGGGKTTLVKLLLRLYDPIEGEIYIDGYDLRDINLKSLRKHVAIVPQLVAFFAGTVAENIAYGYQHNDIYMSKVKQAAVLANAAEFIEKLPSGYETSLSNSASGLSGGQRQRLAIARAIYQEASILVLDEATSALDNNSEKLVRQALERLMAGRTVFIIAHNLETIEQVDRICFLGGGRILEEGTHSSLLNLGGHYAALYHSQYYYAPTL